MTSLDVAADGSSLEWPIVSGRYVVGNPRSSVAICTLASSDLVDEFEGREGFAIAGRLYTLNLGVEKLVWNLISNPAVHFLILCGDDGSTQISRGVYQLHQAGVDGDHRIVGVTGYQPFVPNLTGEEIVAFRERIELVDLIGEVDAGRILESARALEAQERLPWGAPVRHSFAEPVTATPNRMDEIKLDSAGLFLVGIRRESGDIVLDHYSADRRYLRRFVGASSEAICHTLVREGVVTELSHAAYLGREVAKAEEALRWALEYEQDRPLFARGRGGQWAPFGPRADRPM